MSPVLAVTSEHVTFWWITLGLGSVVISAVILLLFLLEVYVRDLDAGVQRVWDMAARVATQTATTWMLPKTVELVGELGTEVQRHVDFLESQRSA
ncbi:MAG TPA: hypothetical protein VHT97_04905 [Acidimicrobiales bacterium]|jgi:hypothetical protein|nr:hypothetical protein [Acidimicrobiales bacterium]